MFGSGIPCMAHVLPQFVMLSALMEKVFLRALIMAYWFSNLAHFLVPFWHSLPDLRLIFWLNLLVLGILQIPWVYEKCEIWNEIFARIEPEGPRWGTYGASSRVAPEG